MWLLCVEIFPLQTEFKKRLDAFFVEIEFWEKYLTQVGRIFVVQVVSHNKMTFDKYKI
jgi:hypothetical protein